MAGVTDEARPRDGYAKLLDAWTGPRDAGEPVGCVATSFTFDAVFFEEECLGRFLRIESDPEEDGALYLIEREEKLAQAACVAIVVAASLLLADKEARAHGWSDTERADHLRTWLSGQTPSSQRGELFAGDPDPPRRLRFSRDPCRPPPRRLCHVRHSGRCASIETCSQRFSRSLD